MNKDTIATFLLITGLSILVVFTFKGFKDKKEDNFDQLNYSKTGNYVIYPSVSNYENQIISGETDLIQYSFDSQGAVLSSYKIKGKNNKQQGVELVLQEEKEKPFALYWGNDRLNPINEQFKVTDLSTAEERVYLFECDFLDNNKVPFTLKKKFTLLKNSYLFKLTVWFESKGESIDIGHQGYAYSVYYGPQLGPKYKKLSKKNAQYHEERLIHEFSSKNGKKAKDTIITRAHLIKNSQRDGNIVFYRETMEAKRVEWVALTGKHFLFIADIPDQVKYDLFYASDSVEEKRDSDFNMVYQNEFFLTQKVFKDKSQTKRYDLSEESNYYFYLGPRNAKTLSVGEKSFGRKDLNFSKLSNRGFFGLNIIVGKIISFINYGINGKGVNNWGWSIVIFTIVLKLALFGLNKKSLESTTKMNSLTPKINEIREKYKNKPQEQNAAIAQLYQKEKINPMMGCLPLLIQFPILIAVYAFINNSYELREAPFFGWMKDLSAPDSLVSWQKNLPLLGWTSFNLLPLLYIATQMVSTFLMQPPKAPKKESEKGKEKFEDIFSQQMQSKMMQFGMPILFFFLLYNAPSGLFVYWITMNIFTLIQQLIFKKQFHPNANGDGKGTASKIQLKQRKA